MNTQRAAWNVAEVALTAMGLLIIYKLILSRLGVSALGVWSLALAATSVARLGDLGIAAGLPRFMARTGPASGSRTKPLEYAETALVANLVLYVVLGAAVYWPAAYALKWVAHGPNLLTALRLLPFVLVSLVLSSLSSVSASALTGLHRSDLKSKLAISAAFLQVIVSWLAIPSFGLVGLAIGQIAQNAVATIGGWILLRRLGRGDAALPRATAHWNSAALREMAGFGLRLQAGSIMGLIYEPATKFVLAALAGPAILGLYELAYRLVTQVRALVVAPSQNLTPMFAAIPITDKVARQRLYDDSMVILTMTGGLSMCLVIVFSPIISISFLHSVSTLFCTMVAFLAVGWLTNIVCAPAFFLATADGQIRWNIAGAAVSSLGSPALGYALWLPLGAFGLVLGYSVATAAGAAVLMIANSKISGVTGVLPARSVWRDWQTRLGKRLAVTLTSRGYGSEPR